METGVILRSTPWATSRAASRTIRPVGVGLRSPGPIGVDGLTMTTEVPVCGEPQASSSARYFERL